VLLWNAAVPKDAIKAKVTKGWVTLSGAVEWPFQRHTAERTISHLIGVKGVINEIEIKPSRTVVPAEVKTGIESALKRSTEVEARPSTWRYVALRLFSPGQSLVGRSGMPPNERPGLLQVFRESRTRF